MSRVPVLAALCAALVLVPSAAAKPPAPGAPGDRHTWAPADKHGFLTAHQRGGNAYATLRQASLSEVYFPDLSTPAYRGLQFAVRDGRTLQRETATGDAAHAEPVTRGVQARVEPLPGALGFRQVVSAPGWRLTKTWITDPGRPVVLADVRLDSLSGRRLQLYVLADPAPGDDGDDDRGSVRRGRLLAWDGDAAAAVAASPRLRRGTSGYAGTRSDPWLRLRRGAGLKAWDARKRGNVVQGALTRLDGVRHRSMTLAIGFGGRRAGAARRASAALRTGFSPALTRFTAGWRGYLASLPAPPAPVAGDAALTRLYQQSVMVLAASEDKLNRGASIASPSMPWVWGTLTLSGESFSGPYHLVWPRDFYHVATAMQAAGDGAAATRLVDYLWRVQKADGSWWQNTKVDGEKFWTSLQLDEVALPVVLAWWLGRRGADDWRHVRAAADFIALKGPKTQQERWENQEGWSPNTIATEIAALICAADIARANGDPARAASYEAKADDWQAKVESWTATSTGPYTPKPYYLRITKDADPDAGTPYELGDNLPDKVDQRTIVDNSFLGLVLFGVKRWDDPTVLNSLAVGDAQLGTTLPGGRMWHRFSRDGYGETAQGGDWDIFKEPAAQTLGRAWPLLSGERGEYELLAGRGAGSYLETIASSANDGLMLPEQVWDGRPPDAATPGAGTRSGTPLAWTHAQFIRLAWSIAAGAPIERPSIVACRYTGQAC